MYLRPIVVGVGVREMLFRVVGVPRGDGPRRKAVRDGEFRAIRDRWESCDVRNDLASERPWQSKWVFTTMSGGSLGCCTPSLTRWFRAVWRRRRENGSGHRRRDWGGTASSPLQLSWIPGVQRQRLEVEIYRNGEKEILCEDFHLDVDEWGRNSWKSERKRVREERKYVQPQLVTAGAKQIVRVT